MGINTIDLGHFTLALLYRFISRVLTLIDKIGADNLGIEKQVDKLLRPAAEKLNDAHKKNRASKFTGKISDTEKLLDNVTTSFFGAVTIGQKSSNPETAAAAKNVGFELKPYKGVARKPRKEQVADTESMIQVLEANCSEDIVKLGLTGLFAEIKELVEDIDAYESSRTEENTDKSGKDSGEAKKETIEGYRAVVKFLEILIMTDGCNESQKEFVGNLNTIIKEFGGDSAGNSDSTTPPEEPTVDYPDAPEWLEDLPFMGVENGDIYYIMVDGKKVFYKLIDKQKFFWHPESERAAGGWEKL